MARILWLIFLSLFSIPSAVHAAFPALPTQYYVQFSSCGGPVSFGSSPSEACSGLASSASACSSTTKWSAFTVSGNYCTATGTTPNSSPQYFSAFINARSFQNCPANSTLSNGMCSCNSGFTQSGSSCIPYNPDADLQKYCSQFSGNKREASVYQTGRGDAGPNIDFTNTCRVPQAYSPDGGDSGLPMFSGTNKGCAADFEYSWSGGDGNGNWTVYGHETYTGGLCTPGPVDSSTPGSPSGDDSPKSKDPDKSCNGYQGTINGVTTCVPYAEKTGADGTAKKTNPDGSTEETKTETTCTGTKCETKSTTTSRDSNGNVTGVTVSTDSATRATYCHSNPKADICKGEGDGEGGDSEFSGSCSAGFSCKGDVLQCVIAKEQHKRACQLIDDKSPETDLYDSSKGKEGDQTTKLPGNRTLDMAAPGMFKTDALFGTGSCIADLNVQVMQRTVQLPLSYLCPWVAELRTVLLALGGLFWLMIVFGRR